MPQAHIVIDLETLDTKPTAVIVSIGAARLEDGRVTSTFLALVDLSEQHGRTISADTVAWWMQQGESARASEFINAGREPLAGALSAFADWIATDNASIWGNGSDFDNAILADAFQQHGMKWPYWRNRCLRTLRGVVTAARPDLTLPAHTGIKHVALDDAIHEARQLAVLLNALPQPTVSAPADEVPA